MDHDPLKGIQGRSLLQWVPQRDNTENILTCQRVKPKRFDLLPHPVLKILCDYQPERCPFRHAGRKVREIRDIVFGDDKVFHFGSDYEPITFPSVNVPDPFGS